MDIIKFLTINPSLFYILIAILGLTVGSFCNVVIYRLPLMLLKEWRKECLSFLQQPCNQPTKPLNLFFPRSHCPACQKPVFWWHNIPLLSYVFLRGKCPHCKAAIALRYPIVELLSCVSCLFVAARFGITWQTVTLLLLTWGLLTLIFIDFEHQLLPDSIIYLLLWLGLACNTFDLFTTIENAIWGAIFGYSSLWLVATLFKLIRKKEGMGHGDFKLLALFGAWTGWQMLPIIILISSLLGSLVGLALILCKKHNYHKPMPFGPYLAVAGWTTFFFGQNIIHWYQSLTAII